MKKKIFFRRIRPLLLSATTIILLSGGLNAFASSENPPSDIWNFIFAIAKENLGAFLLGVVVTLYFLEQKYQIDERLEQLEGKLELNYRILRALAKHAGVSFSSDDL